jgi:NAD(P)-dependent dehydrogenase (short-subunit alcohol dehydrogenase family)
MPTTEFTIPHETALVTGASSGIGKQIAFQFTDAGIDTVICSREQDNVDPVAAENEASDRPGEILPIECDVRDTDAVESMIDETVEAFGGLDLLVNNAGAVFHAEFDDLSENAWSTIVDINLNGVYNCTHAASEALKDGGGAVVNVSSTRSQEAAPGETHYGAAKAGVNNLTKSLGREWAPDGVRVNCVVPGFVATPQAVTAGSVDPESIDRDDVDRQVGVVGEIADVVEFLASEAASFMVGELVTVRGKPAYLPSPEE